MLNRCVIMGRFTGDPIMRYTQSQTPVASFSLACQRDFGRGEEKEVDFINCTAWRNTADFVTKYFRKGSTAAAGRFPKSSWIIFTLPIASTQDSPEGRTMAKC